MKVTPADQSAKLPQLLSKSEPAAALRSAAMQFEAVLLMKLTSSLNTTSREDEDSLFGSDGGSGLAKQMFSEQLATTMSQSGGVGLSDMIMKQMGSADTKPVSGGIKSLLTPASTKKGFDDISSGRTKNIRRAGSLAGQSGRTEFSSDPNDAQVISTFEEDVRANGIDDSLKDLKLDGKIMNSTRARIVPDADVSLAGISVEPNSPMRAVSFRLPVSGRISSDFGNRFHPIDRKTKFHAGIDIAVAKGTSVAAAAEGLVTFAGRKGGYGNLVIIQHPDGSETRYAHLSEIYVSEGESVQGGQPIALSGSTGKSTGPHLHFEVRENGQVVNPLGIMSNVFLNNAER